MTHLRKKRGPKIITKVPKKQKEGEACFPAVQKEGGDLGRGKRKFPRPLLSFLEKERTLPWLRGKRGRNYPYPLSFLSKGG